MAEQAEKGDTIRVHYTGSLESGEVFDSSEGGEPLEFEVGAGHVIEGFDEGVRSMSVGAKKRLVIEADQAYGERNDALVQQVSRASINLDREPEVGMQLALQLPDGNQIPITITEVTPDTITLDANHLLAGETLNFKIHVVSINNATV